jgi:formylglycine-generating enzyme required for sulfatase activity
MNHINGFRRVLVYFLIGFGLSSCFPWDLPTECTQAVPSSLNINTGTIINVTAGGNTANWSLVNSSGSVVLSSSGTNLSFNPTSLASGNYTIRASGRNGCGFTFELSQSYIKTAPIDLVSIPGGTFQMGDTRGEGGSDELPVRSVTVSSFRMSRYEVTQAQWQAVMENNPSDFQNGPNCPVERVSWFDAVAFCNALSIREGRQVVYTINGTNVTANWSANGYRLPTEAEWEYAAGGGPTNRTRFGNGRDILDASEANFNASADFKQSYSNIGIYRQRTMEVGSYISNRFGLYDMSGNVWEWCWDWTGTYQSQSEINPKGSFSGVRRTIRGGCWINAPYFCRVTLRYNESPIGVFNGVGFRVVTQN